MHMTYMLSTAHRSMTCTAPSGGGKITVCQSSLALALGIQILKVTHHLHLNWYSIEIDAGSRYPELPA